MEMRTECCDVQVRAATPFGDDEVAQCPKCSRLSPVYDYDTAMKEMHEEDKIHHTARVQAAGPDPG